MCHITMSHTVTCATSSFFRSATCVMRADGNEADLVTSVGGQRVHKEHVVS